MHEWLHGCHLIRLGNAITTHGCHSSAGLLVVIYLLVIVMDDTVTSSHDMCVTRYRTTATQLFSTRQARVKMGQWLHDH